MRRYVFLLCLVLAGCSGSGNGGNGACDPELSGRDHSPSEDCTGCHTNKHDYSDSNDCTFCHFASQGLVDCN